MNAGLYINFATESKEAIKHYEDIFKTKCEGMMLYGDMPSDGNFPMSESTKALVMNASIVIHGMKIMFSDIPEGMGMTHIVGNNITIVVELKDEEQLTKEFNLLSEGGEVIMPLGKTFWSDKYGYLVDKFGVGWQYNLGK
ncbi:MAG: VOC family protein [Eubacteriaceae bacterium]